MIIIQLLLDAVQDEFDDETERPVDERRNGIGHHGHLAGRERLGRREHLHNAEHEGQGRVLHQGDDLVAHGRQDALDDLGQHNLREGLGLGIAQHRGRLVLAAGNGLDARAVDFREVGGVVQDEADGAGPELPIAAHVQAEQIVGAEHDGHELQHERRAAQDGNVELGEPGQGLEPAHAGQGHHNAEGQRPHERNDEDLGRQPEAFHENAHHNGKFHASPLPL